ncbi:MAG: hypothetical protein ACLR94_17120 [Acutalibacteraceae bacterium]
MEKRKIEEAYRLFSNALPSEKRLELARCSHIGEIMGLAERYNYPLSMDECIGIYIMLAYPEYFNKLSPDAIV